MKRLIIIVGVLALARAFACTSNIRSRAYGGSSEVSLLPGQKLITATWKNTDLWYLTRPARPGEAPERVTFHESSSYGLLEGTVVFVER